MEQRERMEHMRHMQVVLEQACENFQVIWTAPAYFILAFSAAADHYALSKMGMHVLTCVMPTGAQPKEAGRRRDTALSSYSEAHQSVPVYARNTRPA